MKKLIALISLFLVCCTNEPATKRTLMNMGFTNITVQGYSTICSDSDHYCTKFTATNPQGMVVSGAVGCGAWLKGCTIRF